MYKSRKVLPRFNELFLQWTSLRFSVLDFRYIIFMELVSCCYGCVPNKLISNSFPRQPVQNSQKSGPTGACLAKFLDFRKTSSLILENVE